MNNMITLLDRVRAHCLITIHLFYNYEETSAGRIRAAGRILKTPGVGEQKLSIAYRLISRKHKAIAILRRADTTAHIGQSIERLLIYQTNINV